MVPALWAAAERYGIDPVVIVAQAAHETGWGNYGGVVGPERHNTCGLKTRAGGSDTDPNAHATFPDWATGARAHAQHLMAYCQVDVADPIVDPRWVWVRGKRAAITDVEALGGSWAPAADYGNRVAATATKLAEGYSMVVYMPGFEWVGGPWADGSTYIDGVPWRICLHTTETPPISRGGNPRSLAASHNTPPHVWYDWEADQGWQSVTLNRGAAALWSDGNPTTNKARCLQCELVGYAEEAGSWPPIAHERIARRVVIPFINYVRSVGGTIDLSDPAVPLPGEIANSASEYAPQRLSANQWLYGPIGLCQHRHVPRNDHWDAGALDTRRIAAIASGGTPPQPTPQPGGDDEMGAAETQVLLDRTLYLQQLAQDGYNQHRVVEAAVAAARDEVRRYGGGATMVFVQDDRDGKIWMVWGTTWKWWVRSPEILAGFQAFWAGRGADVTPQKWNAVHIDAVPTADTILPPPPPVVGPPGPPVEVVNVEKSLAAATPEQLATVGVARLYAALGLAVNPPKPASDTGDVPSLVEPGQ